MQCMMIAFDTFGISTSWQSNFKPLRFWIFPVFLNRSQKILPTTDTKHKKIQKHEAQKHRAQSHRAQSIKRHRLRVRLPKLVIILVCISNYYFGLFKMLIELELGDINQNKYDYLQTARYNNKQ